MSGPSVYVFDAYGTLFDVHAAIARHRAAAGPDAERFSEIWRAKQLEYAWTLTLAGHYADFWTLTERALDYAFDRVPSVSLALRSKLTPDQWKMVQQFRENREQMRGNWGPGGRDRDGRGPGGPGGRGPDGRSPDGRGPGGGNGPNAAPPAPGAQGMLDEDGAPAGPPQEPAPGAGLPQ